MSNPGLKSKVIENQIPFPSMGCSKDSSNGDLAAAIPISGGILLPCSEVDSGGVPQAPPTSVVIVEPRQMSSESASNGYFGGLFSENINRFGESSSERFILPEILEANADLRRLANCVSAVRTISFGLISQEHTLQRPGCEEGLRSISDYAHKILTTLLEPMALPADRQNAEEERRNYPVEWIMLSEDSAICELLCLVSRLTAMVKILIRLNAPEHTRQHPERKEGMRQLLHCAHQMFNTLLQPPPNPSDRPVAYSSNSLLHLLYKHLSIPTPSRAEGMPDYVGGCFGGISSSPRHLPEGFMLPQAVNVRADLKRLVNTLMAAAVTLTGLRDQAQARQQTEREEGLRMMLHYTHEMFTTLLQPLPYNVIRSMSFNTSLRLTSISLLENIYEPMQEPMTATLRSAQGMLGGGDIDDKYHSSSHPPEGTELPPVDANPDLMSLVNNLMISIAILIRGTCPDYTRQHPEREARMRQMLHYAHQMFNMLLQAPISLDRPMAPNAKSLLHILNEQTSEYTRDRTGRLLVGSQLNVVHATIPTSGLARL